MTPLKKNRILIVDDHPIFCLGMTELINKEEDLEVCGSIELMKKTPEAIDNLKPDLVIIDISLKDGNGIELVQEIKKQYEGLPMLVLSMYDESLYAERALLAGASGYIMKQEAISQVVEAVRKVLGGDIYASQSVKEKVFKRLTNQAAGDSGSPLDILTNRELEVLRLIGEGYSTKEIAERLHLSIKTIGTYRENLKEKLKLKHFTELVKFAVHWSNKILY
ncbi:response regulator [Desulforhopalus singaporensis]|uniref:Two component transcriptional regulator, LuxR family n=1 Tax=Desulforhopalus singaporensis TaxID=91360 RepID=A0A1H0Q6F4_9BACT|nr:response regulator transcription factor [Desulforhopalus singaporensis]SDP12209.1 two component transcriptional regulator, LuxR family [Desulforhopalus singaporensis]